MSGVAFHHPRAQARLAAVRGMIWDLDNTLYKIEECAHHNFNQAMAAVAIAHGVPITPAAAEALSAESYARYHHSSKLFIERFGLDSKRVHFDVHAKIDEKFIEPAAALPLGFAALRSMPHVLLTHASRDWAIRVVKHLGLTEYFPASHILAWEDYKFVAKNQAADGFHAALKILQLPPADVLIIEDNFSNLAIPHRLGMLTVYVTHGRPLPVPQGQMDLSCADVAALLRGMQQ